MPHTRASRSPPPNVPAISTARISGSFVTCAAPSATLASSAAGTAVVAARGRTAASSAITQATTMSAGSFSRLLAWIWWSRLCRLATGSFVAVDVNEPRLCPSAVGAMSTIDTSPWIRVVGESSRPWKPPPITTMG